MLRRNQGVNAAMEPGGNDRMELGDSSLAIFQYSGGELQGYDNVGTMGLNFPAAHFDLFCY